MVPSSMRVLGLVVLVACGGSTTIGDPPAAAIASIDCNRLGPAGTGFMVESELDVALLVGQAFLVELQFPTASPAVNRSDIYNCGSWSRVGTSGVDKGCQRDPGQSESQRVFHSLAIEFADPVPSPASITVTAKPLSAPGSSTAVGDTDTETVTCP